MLEIKERRKSNDIVLSSVEINKLVNSMSIMLNKEMSEYLTDVINGSKTIFERSYLVDIFGGNTKKIANYYVARKTREFADNFLRSEEGHYVLRVDEKDNAVRIRILYEGYTILNIKITDSLIEFELVKSFATFDTMMNQTKKIQEIIMLGEKGFENINRFGYVK